LKPTRRDFDTVLEDVKKNAKTSWSRPTGDDLQGLFRKRKANTFRFKDDGIIPSPGMSAYNLPCGSAQA
jgi:hypothetical protein